MLIRKDGIYREIDEKKLPIYKERGYEVAEQTKQQELQPAKVPPAKGK